MNVFVVVAVVVIAATTCNCNDNLRVAYEWREMDFDYRTAVERDAAIASEQFIPANVIPVGLEVYQTRLFVTLPRWKKGVPASLAYFDINGNFFFFSNIFCGGGDGLDIYLFIMQAVVLRARVC